MCAKFALPILCVHCVDESIFAMEERATSNLNLWCLGSAGVGMERVSKHERKLRCGCWMLGHPGLGGLVGNQERIRGGGSFSPRERAFPCGVK